MKLRLILAATILCCFNVEIAIGFDFYPADALSREEFTPMTTGNNEVPGLNDGGRCTALGFLGAKCNQNNPKIHWLGGQEKSSFNADDVEKALRKIAKGEEVSLPFKDAKEMAKAHTLAVDKEASRMNDAMNYGTLQAYIDHANMYGNTAKVRELREEQQQFHLDPAYKNLAESMRAATSPNIAQPGPGAEGIDNSNAKAIGKLSRYAGELQSGQIKMGSVIPILRLADSEGPGHAVLVKSINQLSNKTVITVYDPNNPGNTSTITTGLTGHVTQSTVVGWSAKQISTLDALILPNSDASQTGTASRSTTNSTRYREPTGSVYLPEAETQNLHPAFSTGDSGFQTTHQ